EGPGLTLFRAIASNAIRAVALPEELSSLRVETLPHRFKILGCTLSFKPKQFRTAAAPAAFDSPILVVIIALPEMALSVALTAGHGTNRQHSPTLALFEVWIQGSCWILENSTPNRARYLRSRSASFEKVLRVRDAPNNVRPASDRERLRLHTSTTKASWARSKRSSSSNCLSSRNSWRSAGESDSLGALHDVRSLLISSS